MVHGCSAALEMRRRGGEVSACMSCERAWRGRRRGRGGLGAAEAVRRRQPEQRRKKPRWRRISATGKVRGVGGWNLRRRGLLVTGVAWWWRYGSEAARPRWERELGSGSALCEEKWEKKGQALAGRGGKGRWLRFSYSWRWGGPLEVKATRGARAFPRCSRGASTGCSGTATTSAACVTGWGGGGRHDNGSDDQEGQERVEVA